MKTIIVSDINNSAESIIPYGLRIARGLESEVDILHVIDPRSHQGTYGSVSDSQSISPGETRSHAETIQYAKNHASIKLDKLLSSEASRLNYPLKINRVIVENGLEEELEHRLAQNPNCLLVVNAEADKDMLDTTDEIVRMIKKTGIPSIIVPPSQSFKPQMNALMPLNLDENSFSSVSDIRFFFEGFQVTIDAVGVASNSDYAEKELKSSTWENAVSDLYLPKTELKTNILEGENTNETIGNYFKRNNRDLLILINKNNGSKNTVSDSVELIDLVKSPTLIYFSK